MSQKSIKVPKNKSKNAETPDMVADCKHLQQKDDVHQTRREYSSQLSFDVGSRQENPKGNNCETYFVSENKEKEQTETHLTK
jgi:hypothetical protein